MDFLLVFSLAFIYSRISKITLRNPFPVIWNYINDAWEGPDGKFSYKRISQFVFLSLISKLVYSGFSNMYQVWALLILTLTFLLLAALINFKDLADALVSIMSARSLWPAKQADNPPPLNDKEKNSEIE